MNVIGDVAGQFDALQKLIAKMPKDDIVLVGDIIDRGPKSMEVVQWAMDNSVDVLMGNHEHMFLDHLLNKHEYEKGMWYMNGGGATMKSYGLSKKGHIYGAPHKKEVILEHRAWLRFLPVIIERDGFVITHAPLNWRVPREQATDPNLLDRGESVIWNREHPQKIKDVIQLFGHNSDVGLRFYKDRIFSKEGDDIVDGATWAVCLDDSGKGKLTGINTKTMDVFQENYV